MSDYWSVLQRVLRGGVAEVYMPGHEVRPRVWVGLNTSIPWDQVTIEGPVYIGSSVLFEYTRIAADMRFNEMIVSPNYCVDRHGETLYRGDDTAPLRREVKLELGTLTDQRPTERFHIKPLIADVYPALFDDWQCNVVALELQRTFWEKATILHAEYHRPPDSPTPARYSRHYFDMVRLLTHPTASAFLTDQTQCERVADWKNRVFARGWARYDLAQPGSFRLVPPLVRQAELARDYATMRPMFMTEPPSFEALMGVLAEAEKQINQSPSDAN